MSQARLCGFVIATVLVVTVFTSVSSAQLRPRQPLLRWMGQGFGDGYHQCNPGPNSDYYNPYSAHNSLLHAQDNPYMVHDESPGYFSRPRNNYDGQYSPNGRNSIDERPGPEINRTRQPADPTESKIKPATQPDDSPQTNSIALPANGSATNSSSIHLPSPTPMQPRATYPNRRFFKSGFRR